MDYRSSASRFEFLKAEADPGQMQRLDSLVTAQWLRQTSIHRPDFPDLQPHSSRIGTSRGVGLPAGPLFWEKVHHGVALPRSCQRLCNRSRTP